MYIRNEQLKLGMYLGSYEVTCDHLDGPSHNFVTTKISFPPSRTNLEFAFEVPVVDSLLLASYLSPVHWLDKCCYFYFPFLNRLLTIKESGEFGVSISGSLVYTKETR